MSQKQNGQMVVDEKRLTVKVSNDVVKAVQPLNASELDLFFAIMAKMKNKGDTLVEIPIAKLIEITHYKGKRFNFYKECRDLFERLPALFITTRDGSKYRFITVFSEITVDVDTGALTAQINDRFVYVLNNLEKHFTIFELEEYVRLDGVHARQLYLLLKQWRKTGGRLPDGKKLLFKIEDIRAAFNLKDTYRTANIEQLIIKPILSQIEALFPNFEYTVVKGGNRGAVTGYHFTFDRETRKEYITAPAKKKPTTPKATPATQQPKATTPAAQSANDDNVRLASLRKSIAKGFPVSQMASEDRALVKKADYEQKEQEYWDKTDDANLKVFAEVNGKYPIGSLKDKEAPSGHLGRFAWERDNKGTMGGESLIRYVELFPEIAELIKQAHPANVQATPAKKQFNPDYQDLCVPPHKRAQQQPAAAPTPAPVAELPEPERPRNVDPFAEFENDTNPDPFAGF